mgnify:CR=1 FL=1
MGDDETQKLVGALATYRQARVRFLEALGCSSNRDPLAEFSERLVATWLGGSLAESRVQKDWDVRLGDGHTVQVRYLANPADRWDNEHHVRFTDQLDWYALAVFEAFELVAVVCLPRHAMPTVCQRLGKRHPDQSTSLQLTRANFRRLLAERPTFERLGLRFLDGTSLRKSVQSDA